jgi:hypothetical protein
VCVCAAHFCSFNIDTKIKEEYEREREKKGAISKMTNDDEREIS